jgi:hypothetical protein
LSTSATRRSDRLGPWPKTETGPKKEVFIDDEEANLMRSRPARQWSA